MRSDDDREAGAAANDEGASAVVDAPSARPALSQTIVGWVTAESTLASLHVDFVGNSEGPLPARSAVVLDDAALLRAVAARQPAVLVFENGDARLPIVLGLIAAPPSPLHALLQPEAPAAAAPKGGELRVEAEVDGKRVAISAANEITLTCGEASLTLRRDGKILLRGTYVETHSRGVNRIKGAQVKIN